MRANILKDLMESVVKFSVGDNVAMSKKWLKSISAGKEQADLRGKITSLKPVGPTLVATIKWNDGSTGKALAVNLVKVASGGKVLDSD